MRLGAGNAGAAVAAVSVPVELAASARQAFAQGGLPQQVVAVLNFALTLEYLESEFYTTGVGTPGLIQDREVFEQIQAHEADHVKFLKAALGNQAVPKPQFDFTAGGQFDTFHDYTTFLILSQGFEDTGVRAYKGQLGNLQPYDAYLTAAARIHSVEARHASEVRRIRGEKGWIPLNDPTPPAPMHAAHAGAEKTTQHGGEAPPCEGRGRGTGRRVLDWTTTHGGTGSLPAVSSGRKRPVLPAR